MALKKPRMLWRALLILTLVVVTLVFVLNHSNSAVENSARNSSPSAKPDYSMLKFNATVMDKNGLPNYQLQALKMDHFQTGRITQVTEAIFSFLHDAQLSWQVAAPQGIIDELGDQVSLSGGVTIAWQHPSGTTTINTDKLRFVPSANYAETADPVTISDPNGNISATGMRVYLNSDRVMLMSRVKGTYVPQEN